MESTRIDDSSYKLTELENLLVQSSLNSITYDWGLNALIPSYMGVSIPEKKPIFKFEIELLDLIGLSLKLQEFEHRYYFSTVEMFCKYKNGELDNSSEMEEWLDTFILYLGTSEIKQYSCP